MARGRFLKLSEMVPAALDTLAAKQGRDGELAPMWAQLFKGPLAKASRPLRLDGGTMVIEVDGELWKKELLSREGELLQRLNAALGGRVKRLSFKLSKG